MRTKLEEAEQNFEKLKEQLKEIVGADEEVKYRLMALREKDMSELELEMQLKVEMEIIENLKPPRDANKEAELRQLFKSKFKVDIYFQVYPGEYVQAHVFIEHSASPKFSKVLGPLTDNTAIIKNTNDGAHGESMVYIKFPYAKLEDVCKGLQLSEGVDLNEDRSKYMAMC